MKSVLASAALVLTLTASLLTPSKAHAVLTAGLIISATPAAISALYVTAPLNFGFWLAAKKMSQDSEYSGIRTALYVIGFIFFDNQLTELPPITKGDLVDSGYSEAQAQQIMSDTMDLNAKLVKEQKIISLKTGETFPSIRQDLKQIAPEASEEFIDVFAKRLSLMAQK